MILLKRTILLIPFRYYTLRSRFWCVWYVSEKPEGVEWNNDDWIQVEGEITTEFYQPFHANIPVLEVTKWNKVEQPKEQYVFRGAD